MQTEVVIRITDNDSSVHVNIKRDGKTYDSFTISKKLIKGMPKTFSFQFLQPINRVITEIIKSFIKGD